MERPGHTKYLNTQSDSTSQESFNYHVLYTFVHAFELYKNKKLDENEWNKWVEIIKITFKTQSLSSILKKDLELRNWLDPSFRNFLDSEIAPLVLN
jgi:hypothetical protein